MAGLAAPLTSTLVGSTASKRFRRTVILACFAWASWAFPADGIELTITHGPGAAEGWDELAPLREHRTAVTDSGGRFRAFGPNSD